MPKKTASKKERAGGLFSVPKCWPCKGDTDCGAGLVCDDVSKTCLPRKGPCGATRRCYTLGGDKCPCSLNPFTTCSCVGPASTTDCPAPLSGGRGRGRKPAPLSAAGRGGGDPKKKPILRKKPAPQSSAAGHDFGGPQRGWGRPGFQQGRSVGYGRRWGDGAPYYYSPRPYYYNRPGYFPWTVEGLMLAYGWERLYAEQYLAAHPSAPQPVI